ncbi:hypothetical protein Pyn_33808 [Prunus yedoensis var. nudiflora]|uniref:Uncharacterized protein n=1 Tax=Prunus yedoensis var. nudiflora TaxID=2094558 RepID=A0A314ZHW1_PRUYE|nr:hypothetical protein Pyn_33808 [Prunus yedoensis var. nudiflora]
MTLDTALECRRQQKPYSNEAKAWSPYSPSGLAWSRSLPALFLPTKKANKKEDGIWRMEVERRGNWFIRVDLYPNSCLNMIRLKRIVDGAYHHYEPSPLGDHVAWWDHVICLYRLDLRVGLVIGSLITNPITVTRKTSAIES